MTSPDWTKVFVVDPGWPEFGQLPDGRTVPLSAVAQMVVAGELDPYVAAMISFEGTRGKRFCWKYSWPF